MGFDTNAPRPGQGSVMDDYRALPTIWTDDHGVTGHIFGIGEPVARIVIETREGTVGIDAPWLDDLAGAVDLIRGLPAVTLREIVDEERGTAAAQSTAAAELDRRGGR